MFSIVMITVLLRNFLVRAIVPIDTLLINHDLLLLSLLLLLLFQILVCTYRDKSEDDQFLFHCRVIREQY